MSKLSVFVVAFPLLTAACTVSSPPPEKTGEAKAEAKSGEAKAGDAKAGDTKAKAPKARRGKQIPPPEDVAAAPADAKKTESGIAYKVQTPGTGEQTPGPNDSVKVSLTAWKSDGSTIETTEGRKTPKLIRLGRPPVPGLGEAVALMKLGEKTRFWIPQELTYKGRKGAPEGTLVYEIELKEIMAAPPVPADVAAPPTDAKKTESGLAYKVLTAGTGTEHPREWDRVKVHYTGWTTDGKMFDSSVTRGREATFALNKVVKGWTEGLQLMVQGEKTRMWIPEELAYKGQPGKPQGMLVFDVELIEIDKQPDPPPVPKDVAAPPADAKKTESGLAYKVLTAGTGTEHPTADKTVEVHYTGWTTDGKMFDSSVTRGKPAIFPLGRVIKGWTEGVQLMVKGEKTRFWIPEALAYQGKPGRPQGMLVFDIELLDIKAAGAGLPPGHP